MNLKQVSIFSLVILMTGLFLISDSQQTLGAVSPTRTGQKTKNVKTDTCCCIPNCYNYNYCYLDKKLNYCQHGHVKCPRETCNYISPPSTTTTSSTTSSTTTTTIRTTTTVQPTSTISTTTSSTTTSSTTTTTIEEGGDSCCPGKKICCKDCLKLWIGTKIVHGCDNGECQGECLSRDECSKKECEDNKTTNETTSTTMVTKNYPVKGKLLIIHKGRKIGEKTFMKIIGMDNNELKSLYISQKNRSYPIKRFNCSGKIFCLNNFTIRINESGNHTYWGYAVGLKPNGSREISSTEPKKINIEVKDLSLKLHNAEIRDNNLSLTYSKDFERCVSLSRYPQENQTSEPILCDKGKHLNRSFSLDELNISPNEKLMICDVEFSNKCSSPTIVKRGEIKIDNRKPRIKVSIKPAKPNINNMPELDIVVNDSDSNIEECIMSIDPNSRGILNPEDGTYDSKTERIHKELGNLSEGDHKISIDCSDTFGNIKTKTQSLEIYPIECKETDRSIDPENPGTLTYGKKNYTDLCSSKIKLKEWYCSDEYSSQEYNCNKYCKEKFDSSFEGKCVENSKGGKCVCKNEKCNKIETNGNPSKKIDLVFVASGYEEDSNFKDVTLKHLDFNKEYNGIFSFKPFSERRDKFNFYYVNAGKDYECGQMCEYSEILKDASYCPYDQIIVLVAKSNGGGYAYTGKGFAVSRSWNTLEGDEFWKYWSLTTAHEFGHSFGGLEDEYFNKRPTSETQGPNCDIKGCLSWCNSEDVPDPGLCYNKENKSICEEVDVPFTPKDCKWEEGNPPYYSGFCAPNFDTSKNFGQNCEKNVGCYWNCKGGNGFKPAQKSVMTGNKNGYNEVSRKFMVNIMQCCYPDSQEQFNKEGCTQWANKNTTKYNLKWAPEECTTYGGQ